jgi:hypothetical protein
MSSLSDLGNSLVCQKEVLSSVFAEEIVAPNVIENRDSGNCFDSRRPPTVPTPVSPSRPSFRPRESVIEPELYEGDISVFKRIVQPLTNIPEQVIKTVIKALPTVRDHTTDQLGPEGDEYIPREYDEADEKKVTATGHLLDGRDYRCRTFFLPNRGDKIFSCWPPSAPGF